MRRPKSFWAAKNKFRSSLRLLASHPNTSGNNWCWGSWKYRSLCGKIGKELKCLEEELGASLPKHINYCFNLFLSSVQWDLYSFDTFFLTETLKRLRGLIKDCLDSLDQISQRQTCYGRLVHLNDALALRWKLSLELLNDKLRQCEPGVEMAKVTLNQFPTRF